MAVKIRLKRLGRRHRPFYRIVAVDQRRARDSRVIEELGHFDPVSNTPEKEISINRERVDYWLGVGAKPSERVHSILRHAGILEGPYNKAAMRSSPKAEAT